MRTWLCGLLLAGACCCFSQNDSGWKNGKGDCMITNRIPGGNIRVVSVMGRNIELDVEMRDSAGDWFYWCFKAVFPEKGVYRFHFVRDNKVGTRGPAFSLDGGRSWRWLSRERWTNARGFEYECPEVGQEVIFCMGMQYLQRDFESFLREFERNPFLRPGTLCRSRKGRNVELVTIREGAPEHAVLLTSRHHAGEMMATHAMEGFLRAVLADSEFGREFRKYAVLYAVPFTDKDGVEDGDQGKNRIPHDYARDYQEPGLYPETVALRKLIVEKKTDFVLDLHCPWIFGDWNEVTYMVGTGNEKMDHAMDRFADLLESVRVPEAPYFKKNNIPFGTSWNTGKNYTQGKTIKHFAAELPFVSCAQTIEIPFANFGEVTVDRKAMLLYGESIAHAVLLYLKKGKTE